MDWTGRTAIACSWTGSNRAVSKRISAGQRVAVESVLNVAHGDTLALLYAAVKMSLSDTPPQ